MYFRNIIFSIISIYITISILGCGSPEEKRMKFFNKGQALYEAGDYVKARLEFKNALQIDPGFAKAYHMLGMISLKNIDISRINTIKDKRERAMALAEEYREPYGLFKKAVDLDSDILESRVELGNIFLFFNDKENFREQVDFILAKEPDNMDANLLNAGMLSREKKYDEAKIIIDKMVKLYPEATEPYILLTNLYIQKKDNGSAVKTLETLLSYDSSNIAYKKLIEDIYTSDKNYIDWAENVYRQLVDKNSDKNDFKIILAQFYNSTGAKDKAEEILSNLADKNQDEVKWRITLANYYNSNSKQNEMVRTLEQALADFPDELAPVSMLSDFYSWKKDEEKSLSLIDSFMGRVTEGPDYLKAKGMKAQSLFRLQKVDESQKLVDEILNENPGDIVAKNLKGDILMVNKDYTGAVSFYRDLQPLENENYGVQLKLARAHLLNEEPELAEEEFKKLKKARPDIKDSYYGLLDIYRMKGKLDLAEGVLNDMAEKFPDDDTVKLLMGDLYYAKNDAETAEENYEKILEKHPDSPIALYKSGITKLAQNKDDEAFELFEKALEKNPDYTQALNAIVNRLVGKGKVKEAVSRCKKQIEKAPNNPVYQVLLGKLYTVQKDYGRAKDILNKELDRNPENMEALYALANVEQKEGSIDSAIEKYRKISKKTPENVKIKLLLAILLGQKGDVKEAKILYEDILRIKPDVAMAANNLAYYYVEHEPNEENLKKAAELITPVLEKNSYTPDVVDTAAWIYFKQGNIEKAKELLKSIESEGEEYPEIYYHLALIHKESGENEMAKNYLEKVLKNKRKIDKFEEAKKLYNNI